VSKAAALESLPNICAVDLVIQVPSRFLCPGIEQIACSLGIHAAKWRAAAAREICNALILNAVLHRLGTGMGHANSRPFAQVALAETT